MQTHMHTQIHKHTHTHTWGRETDRQTEGEREREWKREYIEVFILHILQLSGKETELDRWILSRLSYAVDSCNKGMETYDFPMATTAVYNFWLYELCHWYLVSTVPCFVNLFITSCIKRGWNWGIVHLLPILTEPKIKPQKIVISWLHIDHQHMTHLILLNGVEPCVCIPSD